MSVAADNIHNLLGPLLFCPLHQEFLPVRYYSVGANRRLSLEAIVEICPMIDLGVSTPRTTFEYHPVRKVLIRE